MALEQTHHAADALERFTLLGGREQTHDTAVGHRVFAGPLLFAHGMEGVDQPFGIGLDVFEQLIDEGQEVLAQPRDAGELRSVRGLVQREPQPELAWRKSVAAFHRGHVGADVVHDVLKVRIFFFDHEKVVLTEHPRRHPTEHHAQLDATDAPRYRR